MAKSLTINFALVALVCGVCFFGTVVANANPFGPAVPLEPVPAFGFDRLIAWTAQAQGQFYEGLTGALREVATSSGALWALLGLSFAYGVAHAAGPGHGKVVISSYMLASGETARRGALLALGAGLVQASVAVLLVGLLAGLFGASRAVLSSATITLERFSYALIIALGVYLLYRAVRSLVPVRQVPVQIAAQDHSHDHHHHHDHGHKHHGHGHDGHHDHHHHDHDHDHDEECGCGHAHMPDAQAVAQTQSFGQMAALVFGAGMRPCTGALLVLVLALSQGLFWQGAAAAYAMGIGTALMVGLLAALASILARLLNRQSSISTNGALSSLLRFAPTVLTVVGSLVVIGFGALLLAASLSR